MTKERSAVPNRLAKAFLLVLASCGAEIPGTLAQSPLQAGNPWRHLSMDDVDVAVSRFEPTRARYLQVSLDRDGNEVVEGRGLVHIEVDRAVHSGEWDGKYPIELRPLRDPGLVVDWKVQNSIYNAFDRVLTDSRLSTLLRYMPASAYGLRVSITRNGHQALTVVDPDSNQTSIPVTRQDLPDGSINILTLPYLLAGLDPAVGDRLTFPAFELTGGSDGAGVRRLFAVGVVGRSTRVVRGEEHQVDEVIQVTLEHDKFPADGDLVVVPGKRYSRLLISDKPPYLLGRGNYMLNESGDEVRIREQLDVVDWAAIPLPSADLTEDAIWDMSSDSNFIMLAPQHTPEILAPRR